MRLGFLLIAALVLGAFGAHFLLEDSGYVLIRMRGYAVEMSVPGLVLALALTYAAIRVLVRLWRAPRKIGRAAGQYRDRRARKQLTRGLIAIAEGDAVRGERLLARGAGRSDAPVLNYLTAARAAQQQGADERRDSWLRLAFEREPDAGTAILITQAELQSERGQYEDALVTLRRLDEKASRHGRALALMADVCMQLGRWEDLTAMLPTLAGAHSINKGELANLQERLVAALMRQATSDGDAERVETLRKGLPRSLQARPSLVVTYAECAARVGDHDRLEKLIRKTLKTAWNSRLVEVYGELETSRPTAHLAHVEAWLTRRGEDPVLLLTAARLCMQNQLWGKARSYLETSLGIRPDVVGYRLFGQLLENMGETDAAAEAFRLGLEAATAAEGMPALENLTAERPPESTG
jgi:HemY protein